MDRDGVLYSIALGYANAPDSVGDVLHLMASVDVRSGDAAGSSPAPVDVVTVEGCSEGGIFVDERCPEHSSLI